MIKIDKDIAKKSNVVKVSTDKINLLLNLRENLILKVKTISST